MCLLYALCVHLLICRFFFARHDYGMSMSFLSMRLLSIAIARRSGDTTQPHHGGSGRRRNGRGRVSSLRCTRTATHRNNGRRREGEGKVEERGEEGRRRRRSNTRCLYVISRCVSFSLFVSTHIHVPYACYECRLSCVFSSVARRAEPRRGERRVH